jgi:hypothetical protein
MKGGEKMEKKNLVFLSVIAIVFLLSVTFVSAGWWNDLFGGNSVTGRAVDSYKIQNIVVKEKVKCVFKDATTTQECYSNKGKCKGIGTCAVDVKGKKGEQVTWKSTCGGYAYTTMDGQNDYAEFKCGTEVSESVKCVFNDATTEQECYSEKGSCKGIGTCVVDVKGKKGEQVTWKSTCGGYAYTTMDGQNDYAEFKCGTEVSESVKCVFNDATTEQECYSEKGSCKGIGTCAVDVKGKKGEQVTWKSTCGGYAYTTMDGQNDYAEFKCGTITPGFYKAFWECYDGYHIQASSKKSLISETWNKYAQEDCRGHCYDDGSKCGVNSFGVLE